MKRHEVLIVGAGLAGQRAALEALRLGAEVAIVSKVMPVRSHSVAAAGGINAALNEKDSWKDHAYDTIYGSDFLADQDAVEVLCREAKRNVLELESLGVVFSRNRDGSIAQRAFGGQRFNRTCYAADRTGHALLHTLYDQLMKFRPVIYAEHYGLELIMEKNACKGLVVYDLASGNIERIYAKAVLLATGGYGRAFSVTSNGHANTGDGLALALHAGLPLEDMEFVQFHPTGIYGKGHLVSEASRGEGAHLLNGKNERFMKRYAMHAMELASRDIVSRAIQTEISNGNGAGPRKDHVFLDLRHLGEKKILERLPEVRRSVLDALGIDVARELVPVIPTAHYSMGGIPTDVRTRVVLNERNTPVKGLYAAGECACLSVHGGNRLGGNSLLETLVFGRMAGKEMASFVKNQTWPAPRAKHENHAQKRVHALLKGRGKCNPYDTRRNIQRLMMRHCGVFRNERGLRALQRRLRACKVESFKWNIGDTSTQFNTALAEALETQNMLDFSFAIVESALARQESRGSHYRTDFPMRNDAIWLKHSLAWLVKGRIEVGYKPVVIRRIKPVERRY
ncbi:MAG: FAD-binding protein [Candidatus Diapherotrites archaeon]|nr:FAD-binding protein [Candidatus Diapherotrites archaeon]